MPHFEQQSHKSGKQASRIAQLSHGPCCFIMRDAGKKIPVMRDAGKTTCANQLALMTIKL